MGMEKEYTGSFTLGAVTPTYDLESEPREHKDLTQITIDQINEATRQFTGDIQQVPPIHSAIKQAGRPVYLMARKGLDVKLEPRKVTIKHFSIERIELPKIYFRVVCTTGTYIRSLANDYGAALECGAYLSGLRRTRIGEYEVSNAMGIEDFVQQINNEQKSEGQSDS